MKWPLGSRHNNYQKPMLMDQAMYEIHNTWRLDTHIHMFEHLLAYSKISNRNVPTNVIIVRCDGGVSS